MNLIRCPFCDEVVWEDAITNCENCRSLICEKCRRFRQEYILCKNCAKDYRYPKIEDYDPEMDEDLFP